jgi:N-acetylglucosamine kinase-like BadF-type ATPase
MAKYVIGIDGGGTKAHLCAADLDGNVLYETIGGGTNLCSSSYAQVQAVLSNLVGACTQALGNQAPVAVCIGSGGIVNQDSVEQMKRILVEVSGTDKVFVFHDAYIALKANLGNDAGISITAGTGTICLAQDGRENMLRLSGWGHLFSDEGSAYYIVQKALEKVCQAHDQRIAETRLTDAFLQELNACNFDDLITKIYMEYQEKGRFASLARLVDAVAKTNDVAACAVLEDAARQLFEICRFAADRLFDKHEPFRIVQNGSVLKYNRLVGAHFERWMKEAYPNCRLEFGERAAVWGAVDYAIQASLKDF